MNWTKLLRDLALAGCTQADIAAFCCVAQSTVSDLSRGATKAPSFDFGSKLIEMAGKYPPPKAPCVGAGTCAGDVKGQALPPIPAAAYPADSQPLETGHAA
jgi:hypothetical protein